MVAAQDFYIGAYHVPRALRALILKVEKGVAEQVYQVTQAALGSVGASSTWRGRKLDETGVTIEALLLDAGGAPVQDAAAARDQHLAFIRLIHPGVDAATPQKPPTWDCSHPVIDAVFVKKMAHIRSGLKPYAEHGLAWVSVIGLIESRPLKRVKPAAPAPAQITQRNETPQTAQEKEAIDLLEQLKNA